jgi:hypothetical protein
LVEHSFKQPTGRNLRIGYADSISTGHTLRTQNLGIGGSIFSSKDEPEGGH